MELPEAARIHKFNEAEIEKITSEFGLNCNFIRHKVKAAELLAMRNAWILFQQNRFTNLQANEIRLLLANEGDEIAIDYAILTVGFNHPWIHEKIHQVKNEAHPNPTRSFRDPDVIQNTIDIRKRLALKDPSDHQYQAYLASLEQEAERVELFKDAINHWIDELRNDQAGCESNATWASGAGDARNAEWDIKRAKQRINELLIEIEKQEEVIRKAQSPIRKFKLNEKARKDNPNHEVDDEVAKRKQARKDVARRFVTMWVASLIATLEVNNSAGLAKVTGINKMTWWRWFNGETVPTFSQLSYMLNEKIKYGKFPGELIKNLPTYPKLEKLVSLRMYV